VTPSDREQFASARVARLATVGADGQPHVVPLVFTLQGDTVYSAVDGKPKRTTALRRLANVAANPKVSLLVDRYDEDWTQLWWVRADGHGRVLDDPDAEEVQRAIGLLVEKYPQYQTMRPGGPVLAIAVARWVAWSPSRQQPA
jgi:PPOX class probable F420-dependent enzyme